MDADCEVVVTVKVRLVATGEGVNALRGFIFVLRLEGASAGELTSRPSVLPLQGLLLGTHHVVTRTRVYPVFGSIKWGAAFVPMVSRLPVPGTANVDWSCFHLHFLAAKPAAQDGGGGRLRPPEGQQPRAAPSSSASTASEPSQESVPPRGAAVSGKPLAAKPPSAGPEKVGGSFSGRPGSSVATSQEISVRPQGSKESTHFGTITGESWHERRSLFAAMNALNELAQQQEGLQDEDSRGGK